MSKVYESLKEVVQETLQRNKSNPIPSARIKHPQASSFTQAIEELETTISQKIAALKSGVSEGEQLVEDENQRAQQVISSLRENVAALQAKLKDSEDTARRKDSASQKMEESLNTKIRNLENELKKKSETMQSRDTEFKNLKANVDVLVKQATELEVTIKEAKAEAAKQTNRMEQMTGEYQAKRTALETRVTELNEVIRGKESTLKEIERNLAAKMEEFEHQLRDKESLLAARDADINDLKSQLQLLSRGVKEMSSFFRQAEALVAVEGQNVTPPVASEPVNGAQERLPAPGPEKTATATDGIDRGQRIVPPDFFELMTKELTQIMGPMAKVIVSGHVTDLGESLQKFPSSRLPDLLNSLSKEISTNDLKVRFRDWFAKHV